MNSKIHGRSSSHGRKLPTHARPANKPPPLSRRGTSFNHSTHHHTQSPVSNNTNTKMGAGWNRRSCGSNHMDEDDDMASFLQFCATCEKQIVTPSATLLYCSEACRKKDTMKSPPPSVPLSPLLPALGSIHLDTPPIDILPQMSPTVLRPVSLTFSDLTISECGSPTDEFYDFYLRHDSDATTYLEQFNAVNWNSNTNINTTAIPPHTRPIRSNTASEPIPSLSHTPSSSVGTVGSAVAPPATTTTAAVRPLPSRRNPSYSAFSSKPIDLGAAHVSTCTHANIKDFAFSPTQLCKDASHKSCASTLTAFRVAEATDVSYDDGLHHHHHRSDDRRRRASLSRRDSGAQASLRQLFSHDAMRKHAHA